MRRLVVSLVAAMVALSLVPIASAQEEDDQVTLRVGLTQDWEVLNPTSGLHRGRVRGLEPPLRHTHRQGRGRFRHHPRSGRIVGGGRARHRVRLHAEGGPDLVRRRAITAEDVAWNINTGRDQGWDNMVSTVANIEATAEDERTVRLVSSVPDPKLPTMDVYLVPQHIWEPIATDYDASHPIRSRRWRGQRAIRDDRVHSGPVGGDGSQPAATGDGKARSLRTTR